MRLSIRGDASRIRTKQLVRATKIPSVLPQGLLPKPELPPLLEDPVAIAQDIDLATTSWYETARREWSSLKRD